MDRLSFLAFNADFSSPALLAAYDELPLWSAMFGLLMLEEVPLANVRSALDVGCGTGFPLIEIAERFGPDTEVHGIDVWTGGLERAKEKVAARATPNVTIHEGSATSMPFSNDTFDLIVSNLGVNNFDDRAAAIEECRRVARAGSAIALTTNLQGHMHEFYSEFAEVLAGDPDALARLDAHVGHRATIPDVRRLLEEHRFAVRRVVEREHAMRFASGTALLNHHFIKLGFLDAWKAVTPGNEAVVFARLIERLNAVARQKGELRLTIPMAYVEGVAI